MSGKERERERERQRSEGGGLARENIMNSDHVVPRGVKAAGTETK